VPYRGTTGAQLRAPNVSRSCRQSVRLRLVRLFIPINYVFMPLPDLSLANWYGASHPTTPCKMRYTEETTIRQPHVSTGSDARTALPASLQDLSYASRNPSMRPSRLQRFSVECVPSKLNRSSFGLSSGDEIVEKFDHKMTQLVKVVGQELRSSLGAKAIVGMNCPNPI